MKFHNMLCCLKKMHLKFLVEIGKLDNFQINKINNLTKEERNTRNEGIVLNPHFTNLAIHAHQDHNVQNMYQRLMGILKKAFKDRHRKAKQSDDWEAEADFERLHAHHELFPQYEKAKKESRTGKNPFHK